MKEEKKNGGFGKFLLGIVVAAIAVVAYKKVPAVTAMVNKAGEGIKRGATKIGESLTKCGEKKPDAENTATQQAPKTETGAGKN